MKDSLKRTVILLAVTGMIVIAAAGFFLVASTSTGTPHPGTAREKQIAIISMPDIHSAVLAHANKNGTMVGGLAPSAALVQDIRKNYDGSLLLSSGDDLGNDESGMYFRLFHGIPERRAMSVMGFDAGTIGNHDFDEGPDIYADALGATSFPVVSANIRFENKSMQEKIRPYIIRNVAGVRVGIFGLSYPGPDEYATDLRGISIEENTTAVARAVVQDLRDRKADLVIALTHLGKKKDRKLAESVDGIDLIIGGHDHIYSYDTAVSPSGRRTIMTDSGVYGEGVGVLSFRYNGSGVEQPAWTVIPVDGSKGTNATISAILEPYTEAYRAWQDTAAGSLGNPLDSRNTDTTTGQSEIGTFVTNAMRTYGSGADIAFCPTGSLNRSAALSGGIVTNGDLGRLIDHNNRLSWIRMPGRDILEVLEISASFQKPLNGSRMGVVTPVHPLVLQVSGLRMQIDPTREAGGRVSGVQLETERGLVALDQKKEYTVVVNTRIGQFDARNEIFQDEPAGNIRNTDVRILDTVMDSMARQKPGVSTVPVPATA